MRNLRSRIEKAEKIIRATEEPEEIRIIFHCPDEALSSEGRLTVHFDDVPEIVADTEFVRGHGRSGNDTGKNDHSLNAEFQTKGGTRV